MLKPEDERGRGRGHLKLPHNLPSEHVSTVVFNVVLVM